MTHDVAAGIVKGLAAADPMLLSKGVIAVVLGVELGVESTNRRE